MQLINELPYLCIKVPNTKPLCDTQKVNIHRDDIPYISQPTI